MTREKIRDQLNKYPTTVKFFYKHLNWTAGAVWNLITLGKRADSDMVAQEIHIFTGGKKDGDKIRKGKSGKYQKTKRNLF